MHAVIDREERARIAGLARKYLDPYQPKEYRLEVIAETIEQDDELVLRRGRTVAH